MPIIIQKIHLGIAGTVLLAGCAAHVPPMDDWAHAQDLVGRADTPEVAEHAPLELRFARDKLRQAQAAVAKDPEQAALLAQEASADAELALAKSRQTKARLAVQKRLADNERLRRELLAPGSSP